jgi:hypothetical protein
MTGPARLVVWCPARAFPCWTASSAAVCDAGSGTRSSAGWTSCRLCSPPWRRAGRSTSTRWSSGGRYRSLSPVERRAASGERAVLKISVDRERINHEAVALARWETRHVPVVLAWDQDVGALLLEAVEPGTPLDLSGRYSSTSSQAARRPGAGRGRSHRALRPGASSRPSPRCRGNRGRRSAW